LNEAASIASRRFLLIGGNGFIGSHIKDLLADKGDTVRILDRYPERYRDGDDRVDYRIGDFSDLKTVKEALKGMDTVIHLQSTTVPATSEHSNVFDIESNLIPTVRLLEAMADEGCKDIIYLSSGGAVYGNPLEIPISEASTLSPISSYGVIKSVIERYLHYFERYGIRSLIIRPSNLYGIRQGNTGVLGLINTLLEKTLRDEEMVIFGDGSAVKDYVHVNDLLEFLSIAIGRRATGVFNVGSGEGVSVNEVIASVQAITGKAMRLRYEKARPYDVARIVLDITKAKAALGWHPAVKLEDGIREVWNHKLMP
jgi:UDP-glucose 4-epimerase